MASTLGRGDALPPPPSSPHVRDLAPAGTAEGTGTGIAHLAEALQRELDEALQGCIQNLGLLTVKQVEKFSGLVNLKVEILEVSHVECSIT